MKQIKWQLRKYNFCYNLKNRLTKFIKVKENSNFSDHLGLIRLRLNFSHFNEHKFRYTFRYTANHMPCCSAWVETTNHYLLRCQNFAYVRSKFFNRIFEINVEFRNMNALSLTSLLLFGSEKQTFDIKTKILNLTIQFWKDSGRFEEPLIWLSWVTWLLSYYHYYSL